MKIFKDQFKWWRLIVLLALLVLIKPYFQPGVPFTHDGENHLARFANYKVAVREGQLPPRLAPNLMNHYGYPVFNYNYPLLNLLSLPFSAIDIHYELAFKLLMTAGLALGAWGVYRWLAVGGFSKASRLFSVGVYWLAPFTVNLIYVRGNIGELWALALFPWLLWFTQKLKRGGSVRWLWSVSLITAFLLSHNISVLFGGGLWFLYTLFQFGRQTKLWRRWLLPVLLSILLSLWFWLPALAEKQFVVVDDTDLSSQFSRHFTQPLQLITAPLQFGYSYDVPIDTISLAVGLAGFVSLGLVTVWLLKRKPRSIAKEFRWLWLLVFTLWGLLFLQTGYSEPIWKLLPLVQFIQFPWRLTLFFIVLVLPLTATAFAMSKGVRLILWLCLLVQLIAVWRLQPLAQLHKTAEEYDLFPQSTSTLNENLTKGFTYLLIGDWQPAPSALEGAMTTTVLAWTGSSRNYRLTVSEAVLVVEPTMFFPGWETTVNGEKITYADMKDTQGRIGYRLPVGEYEIVTRFTQRTWPRLMGNTLSLLGFGIWIYIIWQEKQRFSGKFAQ